MIQSRISRSSALVETNDFQYSSFGSGDGYWDRAALRMAIQPAAESSGFDPWPNDAVGPVPQNVASTLSRAQVAMVGYNTGFSSAGDPANTTVDSLQFLIVPAVGSGTIIRFTDRAWNGTSFTNAAGDGSFAFTAATDLAANTVVTATFSGGNVTFTVNGTNYAAISAGGFDINEAGDAVYVYQGSGADTPTTFLTAIELADGNATFNGNLSNTGLTAGTNAVAVKYDTAAYSGPSTDAYAHFYNGSGLLQNINDSTNWTGDDHVSGGQVALDQFEQSVFNVAPDLSLWSVAGAGGGGVISTNVDSTVGGGTTGHNLVIRYTNDAGDPVQVFANPLDIAFDTAEGKFFIITSTAGEDGKILQGNISDLIGNPNLTAVTTTLLYTSNQALGSAESQIRDLQIDTVNNIIYFTHGQRFEKIVYNTAGQTSTVLANFGTGSGNPNGTTNNFMDDFVINFATGTVYLSSHRIVAAVDGDSVTRNYIYRITGLDPADGTNAFTFGNGLITVMPFSPDDDDVNNGINMAAGEGFPQEHGTLEGLALSADGNTLYFTAARTLYDHDGDGGFAGDGNPATTDPILTLGGVFSYALTGNPTGTYTALWVPTDDGNDGSQAISEVNGPQGLLDDIEVDPVTGQLYFVDLTGDQIGITNPPGDEGIWRINANGTGREFIQAIFNNDGLGAANIFLNRAPTVTSSTQATPGVTEASNAPSSGATALVQPFLTLDVTDIETAANATQQLHSATVWISNNFQSGATHQDTLTINGLTSGTTAGGINFSYNAATGAMTLTGTDTFNDYEAAIALVRFNTSGDDVTAYGAAGTRTISWAVSDGLNHSDPVSTTVTVTGINDAPVNTPGAAMNFSEDTTGNFGAEGIPPTPVTNAVTGISVFDVDADPATQDITVTLSVGVGTLTIRTNVAGGIQASDVISGNGTGTIVITATQNEINTTLAAMSPAFTGPPAVAAAPNGLIYTPPANYNGATNLTITTNDNGFNGNDPGLTGTGTSEQDQDVKVINIADVNDAPTVGGDGTEDATTILEDTPSAVGQTVSSLFGGQFADLLDIQVSGGNPTGSPGDTLAGIAIVGNGSSGATGQWQYFNGASWVDIGAASPDAAKTLTAATAIRFNPVLNFNGSAPTLIVRLIETGGPAITNGGTVDLNPLPPATGPTAVYATNNVVVLSQTITAVNDAPVNTVGSTLTVAEDSGATNVTGMSISDVDSNAAVDVFTVTLDVLHGTLNLSTAVVNGVTAGNVTGNGTGTLVISGTMNQINNTLAAAGGLTYTPTGNYNGSDRVQITTNDNGSSGQDPGLTGSPTNEQDQDSKTINVTAVNDPVTGAAPASATMNEDATSVAISGLSISDVDAALAPAGVYEVQLTATNGTLTLTTITGLTFTANDGTADATMTFHGTLADINAALATASYTPTANYAGSATITLNVTDTFGGIVATGTGVATNDSDVVNVTVNAVNDAPVNNVPGATQNVNEDGSLSFTAGNLNLITVTDVDSASGDLTVTLTVLHGTLSLGGNAGLTGETGDGTASITISGPLAAINNALNGLSYTPTGNYNGPDTLTITTNDNGNTGADPGASGGASDEQDQDTVTINVVAQNDSPVVSLVASASSTEQVAGAIDAAATISDADLGALNGGNGDYAGSSLNVTRNGGMTAEDLINFGASGSFTVNGGNLEAPGGLVFATFTGGNGTTLVINFTSTATPATQALVNAVIQSLQYTFTGDSPPASIVLDYSFDDGAPANAGQGAGGTPTGTDSITINITDTFDNVAPVLDLDANDSNTVGTGYTGSFTEGGAASPISDSDVSITDSNPGDDVVSATITITNPEAGDLLSVTLPLPPGISVDGANSTATTLILIGSAAAADYQTALAQVAYSNTGDDPTDGGTNTARTINVTVNDGDTDSNVATAIINITAVEDSATAVDDPGNTTPENASVTISVLANDSDPDGPPPSVAQVNGTPIAVGGSVILPSGARVTLNAGGTLTYDPNGQFNTLTSTSSGQIGAVNTSAPDSFTYTLAGAGGGTATVSLTVNGVVSPDDHLDGDGTNNTISGTPLGDYFDLSQGGDDSALGLGSNDGFFFGAEFDENDTVDGGGGNNDQIGLLGDYTGANALNMDSNTIANIEAIVVLPGFSYEITTDDGNVGPGGVLKIQATQLGAGNSLIFDGSAETDGSFIVYGGQGNDQMTGGQGNDGFYFGPGAFTSGDLVDGGMGNNDQLGLDGNYGAFGPAFELSGGNISNVEVVVLLPGPSGSPNSFNLVTNDSLVGAGGTMTIFGLQVTTNILFNGAFESDGSFRFYGGAGSDSFTGSLGGDWIFGGGGGDQLSGGAGADTYFYDGASQSTSLGFDKIFGFDDSVDTIDLPFAVTGFASPASGNLSTATFDADLSSAFSGLTANQAGVFTATGGDMNGRTFLVVDADGVLGYQAGNDYVIEIVSPTTPIDNPAIFV